MKTLKELIAPTVLFGLAGLALSSLPWRHTTAEAGVRPAEAAAALAAARGEYLVRVGGCADCHTPKKLGPRGPEDDTTRWLAGHPEEAKLPPPPPPGNSPWFVQTAGQTAWAGPWGITYSANLTPDVNTGLGIWTEEMFMKAMRTGKHMGSGRDILPPMPWNALGRLTDEDLRSVFAYLKSIPPVTNHVPSPVSPGGHTFE